MTTRATFILTLRVPVKMNARAFRATLRRGVNALIAEVKKDKVKANLSVLVTRDELQQRVDSLTIKPRGTT